MIRAGLAIAAFVLLAALWPGWRRDEAEPGQAVDAAAFVAEVHAFAARHRRGEMVAPPPGAVPLLARRFEFWPSLRLEAGQTYRLRVMAEDSVHSLAVRGREVLLVPGRVHEIAVTPRVGEEIELRCNEYCGLGHNRMRLRIY